MDSMLDEYEPTDAFMVKMQKMTLQDFECDYADYSDKKKTRNAYDSRMRKKNIMVYYMHSLISKNTRNIATQTDVSHVRQIKLNVLKTDT